MSLTLSLMLPQKEIMLIILTSCLVLKISNSELNIKNKTKQNK